MKYLLTILLCFALSFVSLFAQTQEPKIRVKANWFKGDQLTYEVTKIDLEWYQYSLIVKDTLKYLANFHVIDSTKDFYKIEWKFGNTLLQNYEFTKEQETALAKYEDIDVIYTTNKQGKFLGIDNWKSIANMLGAMFTDLIKVAKENLKGEEKYRQQKQLEFARSIYTSKLGVERQLLNEVFLLHKHFSNSYHTTQNNYYETVLSGIGGINHPIRQNQEIYIDASSLKDGICKMKNDIKINQKDARRFIQAAFERIGENEKGGELVVGDSQLDIKSQEKHEYNIEQGILLRLETNQSVLLQIRNEKQRVFKKVKVELLKHKD